MDDKNFFFNIPDSLDLEESIAVNSAIEKLRHGRYDPKAAEVEQQVRAEFRRRKAIEESQGQGQAEEA